MRASGDYLSNREWLRDAVSGKDLILCHASALEYHELFVGYLNEREIDVYAKKKGQEENLIYHVVDNFDNIDYIQDGNVMVTTIDQTINDMLHNFDNTDVQALTEALAEYYYAHNNSFDGLNIKPENLTRFNEVKEWAVNYYDEVTV